MLGKQCLREGASLGCDGMGAVCVNDAAAGTLAVTGRRCVSEAQASAAAASLRTLSWLHGVGVRPCFPDPAFRITCLHRHVQLSNFSIEVKFI